MAYRIKLEVFEGPLDLLLYLIKREELNIYDIPIAHITEQYLETLEFLQMLNLDIAGEFLVMAATLMHIKSKMLLPPEEVPPEVEEEEEDPRRELIEQLLEYRKFKEAAELLRGCEEARLQVFGRAGGEALGKDGEYVIDASIFDLVSALRKVLTRLEEPEPSEIIDEAVTVEEKIRYILDLVRVHQTVTFMQLFEGAVTRTQIIVTFLALLELVRLGEVGARQAEVFGEIRIVARAPEEDRMRIGARGAVAE